MLLALLKLSRAKTKKKVAKKRIVKKPKKTVKRSKVLAGRRVTVTDEYGTYKGRVTNVRGAFIEVTDSSGNRNWVKKSQISL
jgi:hypothetical protein